MNFLFLFMYLVIILAVIEIFVILFRLTGLKVEVSRFQVISMMTGTGFTTGESELILGHPIRRKLAIFLILFGAFSLAVIISSISQFLSNGIRTREIFGGAATVIAIFGILKLGCIQRLLTGLLNRKMKQNIELADLPIREVFLKNKEDALVGLSMYPDSHLVRHTLRQWMGKADKLDLVVLFIKRGEVTIKKDIYDTTIHEGDQLLIFGAEKVISQLFGHDLRLMRERRKDLDEMLQ